MVLPAGQYQRPRIGPDRCRRLAHRIDVGAQCIGVQIEDSLRSGRDMAEIRNQPVGHIGHRLRAGRGGDNSLPVGRVRHPVT